MLCVGDINIVNFLYILPYIIVSSSLFFKCDFEFTFISLFLQSVLRWMILFQNIAVVSILRYVKCTGVVFK